MIYHWGSQLDPKKGKTAHIWENVPNEVSYFKSLTTQDLIPLGPSQWCGLAHCSRNSQSTSNLCCCTAVNMGRSSVYRSPSSVLRSQKRLNKFLRTKLSSLSSLPTIKSRPQTDKQDQIAPDQPQALLDQTQQDQTLPVEDQPSSLPTNPLGGITETEFALLMENFNPWTNLFKPPQEDLQLFLGFPSFICDGCTSQMYNC